MKQINLSEKDYKRLRRLLRYHEKMYGNEETAWSFQDLVDIQEIGTEIAGILTSYLKTKNAKDLLNSK